MTNKVTDKTLNSVIASNEIVMLDMWAEWCGPCKMIMSAVNDIAKERSNVFVGKMDVDQNKNTLKEFSIRVVPTILLFKNGKLAYKQTGIVTKKKLLEQIDRL